jgi:hypothetical protein
LVQAEDENAPVTEGEHIQACLSNSQGSSMTRVHYLAACILLAA